LRFRPSGFFTPPHFWAAPVTAEFGEDTPHFVRTLLYQPSNLALFYFAFGWNERRPMLAHYIALASICVFAAAAALSDDQTLM
jgi:hypothetical protein